jgi:outer membrane protein OmpA-like peptidoglycan-associated protein
MVPRRDPKTGKPVCLEEHLPGRNTDTLFATDSATLTAAGRAGLKFFFSSAGAFGYAIYGHTDSRASDEYNMGLSQRRAKAVADVARSVGAVVDSESAMANASPSRRTTAAGMAKNRRVEVVCYRTGDDACSKSFHDPQSAAGLGLFAVMASTLSACASDRMVRRRPALSRT